MRHSLAVLLASQIPTSYTMELESFARSSSSFAYWHTNFFYEKLRRAKRCEERKEAKRKPPVFLHTETKVRVVMYDLRGQVYKGARVGGLWSLYEACTCAGVHASPRQFLRGAISFVIYFAGGNSCFRNAIRAWPGAS